MVSMDGTERMSRRGLLPAAGGAFFVLAGGVGNALANSGATGDPLVDAGRAVTAIYAAGVALEVLAFVAFAFFAAWLVVYLRRYETGGGSLAGTAGIAAAVTLAIKLGSAAPVIAAHQRPGLLTADLARTLEDLNGGAFVISGLTFALFVLAAAASAISGRALPRWLGWTGVVVGAAGLVTPIIGIVDPADYNPVPFMLCVQWTLVVSVLLTVRVARAARVGATVPPTSVASTVGGR
jgi:hypothetical protein